MFLNNRGISEVIAALLLIAIAISAAILLYAFSSGLLGPLQGGGGEQIKKELILEAYDWTSCCPGNIRLWLRNVGSVDLVVADVFIDGLPVHFNLLGQCHHAISIQSVCRATVNNFDATIVFGAVYVLKLVTFDGAVFVYSVTGGKSA